MQSNGKQRTWWHLITSSPGSFAGLASSQIALQRSHVLQPRSHRIQRIAVSMAASMQPPLSKHLEARGSQDADSRQSGHIAH
jgi:hypothetical protein